MAQANHEFRQIKLERLNTSLIALNSSNADADRKHLSSPLIAPTPTEKKRSLLVEFNETHMSKQIRNGSACNGNAGKEKHIRRSRGSSIDSTGFRNTLASELKAAFHNSSA